MSNERIRLITNSLIQANIYFSPGKKINRDYIEIFRDIILDKFDLSDHQDVKRYFGRKKSEVRKILIDALPSFIDLENDIPVFDLPQSDEQYEVVRILATDFLQKESSAFLSDDMIIEDLFTSLKDADLVSSNDYDLVMDKRDWVAAYCLSVLHLTSVELAAGARATLHIGMGYFDDSTEHLAVNCKFMPLKEKGVNWVFPILSTHLLPKNWCDPTLLPILQQGNTITEPIECDDKGMLQSFP